MSLRQFTSKFTPLYYVFCHDSKGYYAIIISDDNFQIILPLVGIVNFAEFLNPVKRTKFRGIMAYKTFHWIFVFRNVV